MPPHKSVASPEEKFSAGEFEAFLDSLDITDADAARLLGVAEATIKRCRKHGITGFGARFVITIVRLKLDAPKLAKQYGVMLTGLSRKKFQAQRVPHNVPKSLVPPEIHRNMVLMYLREEGAANTAQLQAYFERKAGKPDLVKPLLASMEEAGMISCDGTGYWTISEVETSMAEAAPRYDGWEKRSAE